MAVIAAEVALKRAKAECAEPRAKLGVMRVASEAADLGPETYGIRYVGSWSETWPISLCSRTVEVRVDFTADGDGGAYHSIKEKEMTILPLGQ